MFWPHYSPVKVDGMFQKNTLASRCEELVADAYQSVLAVQCFSELAARYAVPCLAFLLFEFQRSVGNIGWQGSKVRPKKSLGYMVYTDSYHVIVVIHPSRWILAKPQSSMVPWNPHDFCAVLVTRDRPEVCPTWALRSLEGRCLASHGLKYWLYVWGIRIGKVKLLQLVQVWEWNHPWTAFWHH